MTKKKLLFSIGINSVDYKDLIQLVKSSIVTGNQISISGVNVNTLNLIYKYNDVKGVFLDFDVLHPDGIGIFLASKIIAGGGFNNRITGSDFYKKLIPEMISNKWKVFLFGDLDSTLERISINYPNLNIVGLQNGFCYKTVPLVKIINDSDPDILIVGMGAPKQEKWIMSNKNKINANVILAVGEGIRIFAGTKIRGYLFIQKLGFEWFIRLINNPKLYWKRYLVGIPLFFYRFIKLEVFKKNV